MVWQVVASASVLQGDVSACKPCHVYLGRSINTEAGRTAATSCPTTPQGLALAGPGSCSPQVGLLLEGCSPVPQGWAAGLTLRATVKE